MKPRNVWRLAGSAILFVAFALSCGGGGNGGIGGGGTTSGAQGLANPVNQDICNCTPTETVTDDYRHDAKHISLPGSSGTQVSVGDILAWPQGTAPASDAPRSGRELEMFFIPHAYLQFAQIMEGDCDIHVELSDVPDKNAPRIIVETPIDPEYCDARNNLKSGLAAHGFNLATNTGEANPAIAVSVLGLAFQDYEHSRGTALVATTWEIHPAIVTVLP